MPNGEWGELVGRSGLRDVSRTDIEHELMSLPMNVTNVPTGGVTATGPGYPGGNAASTPANQDLTQQMTSLVSQISSLNATQLNQISALEGNTQALTQNTSTRSSAGASVGDNVLGAMTSMLGGGLSLAPLISGLAGVFGGGSSSTPAAAPFLLPAPVQYQAGLSGGPTGAIGAVDYGQTGQPREVASSSSTNVTVQVNAMDSRSFLDHSDEIANAVRTALLNSNALNDVISGM